MAYKDLTFLLFAKDMSASRGFEKVAASGDRMATGLKGSMGLAAIAVAGLAIDLGAKTVKMAADFQTATTRLVTDAGESEANLGKVSNGILNISESVGTSATEIAKGMYYVESAGYHGAAGLEVMRAAAEGAKVGGAEMQTVADALTTVMKDYGISAGKANNTTSELIQTVSRGKTTMEDLAGSLHSVLPNAEALGIKLNDVLGALATMTQEGISADQATQNLNHTIVSLANPTHVQAQEMAAMGLNATKVAKDLGKKGLTGTLDELVEAITSHMGKSGLVLQSAFNQSALAAQSANTMFKHLPRSVQDIAGAYQRGAISQKTWNADVKAMTPAQANLAKQWATTQNQARGFSQILKSGSGSAQTFTAALAKMTGGQTGLQVALHITGLHAQDTAANVKAIGDAARGTQKDVSDWDKTQKTFNQTSDEASAAVGKLGIQIGQKLLPYLTDIEKQIPGVIRSYISLNNTISGGVKFIMGLVPSMVNAGEHLVGGLIQGIGNELGSAETAVENVANSVISSARTALGIHSPSTVFREIGSYVGKGLEQGLLGSQGQIQGASNRLANSVMSAFKSKDISKGAEVAGLATIDRYTNRLQALSKRRASVEKQLTSSQSTLADLRTSRTDTISSTKSATVDAGNVLNFDSTGGAIQGLQAVLGDTRRFKSDLTSLSRKGIDSRTFTELVNGWQSDPASALRAADELLANPTDLRQIVALQRQLGSAASSLGTYAGNTEYNPSIASTGRQVASLKGRDKVLTWEMQKAAENALKRVAHETHVHLHLTGTFAGTKTELAKTVTQAIKDAENTGAISKNWNR